jgi:hypothetical protein
MSGLPTTRPFRAATTARLDANAMRATFVILGSCCLILCSNAEAQTTVREADLCEIAAHPMEFNGQMVRVRGDLESTIETYVIAKGKCAAVPPEDPESVTPRPTFALRKDAAYRKLERMQRANSKQMQCVGPCPNGPYYHITATVMGRVDAVPESAVQGPPLQWRGFGNRHGSTVRIVIQSYSEVDGHKRVAESGADE